MSISVLRPGDWNMKTPAPGVAGRHPCMLVNDMEEKPYGYTETHSHDVPEVFTILAGRLFFNGQWCEAGSVVFVPAGEDYWFATGSERCVIARICPAGRGRKINARETMTSELARGAA